MVKRSAITDVLFGYTGVKRLEFVFHPAYSSYDLCLVLENPLNGKIKGVTLSEVSHLAIREFGGGLTQLLYLMVEDIRDFQLDRVTYRVKDMERNMLECS